MKFIFASTCLTISLLFIAFVQGSFSFKKIYHIDSMIEVPPLDSASWRYDSQIPKRGEELVGIIKSQSLGFGPNGWDSISGSVYSFNGSFRVKLPL